MPRVHSTAPLLGLLCLASPILASRAARAGVIDSFETGGFSLSRSTAGTATDTQSPNPAHCIAAQREVLLDYGAGATGVMTSDLVPLDGVDDAIVTTFPNGFCDINMFYEGGPWDLTEGGTLNRITVRVTGAGPQTRLRIVLEDAFGNFGSLEALLYATGHYQFGLSHFQVADPTAIVRIRVAVFGSAGETIALRKIETTNGSTSSLIYTVLQPSTITYFCAAPPDDPATGSGSTIAWNWTLGWPTPPTLPGPELFVTGISGPQCTDVRLTADGDEETGLVTLDWLSDTFTHGEFGMRFTLPGPYLAQLQGELQITSYDEGFVIGHDVSISGVPGVPAGIVHQELVVSVHPDQEAVLGPPVATPFADAAGYTLGFEVAAVSFDPAHPLLEMFTSATYMDADGATGAPRPSTASASRALVAQPGLTRTGTRFLLPADAPPRTVVDVLDVTGRRVRRLEASGGAASWDGADDAGAPVSSGVYFGRAAGVPGTARVVRVR